MNEAISYEWQVYESALEMALENIETSLEMIVMALEMIAITLEMDEMALEMIEMFERDRVIEGIQVSQSCVPLGDLFWPSRL